jgi:hypothetical protein
VKTLLFRFRAKKLGLRLVFVIITEALLDLKILKKIKIISDQITLVQEGHCPMRLDDTGSGDTLNQTPQSFILETFDPILHAYDVHIDDE